MACIDIVAEQCVLFAHRTRTHPRHRQMPVAGLDPPHGASRLEFVDEHAHRHAGVAALAIGHVGNVLAATEAAAQQVIDQQRGLVRRQMREQLAFEPSRQIRAGLRRGHVEFRKVLLLLAHEGAAPADLASRDAICSMIWPPGEGDQAAGSPEN